MRKFVFISVAIAFSSLLTGCGASNYQEPRWYKSGVSEEDAKSAHAQCIYKVGMNKVDAPKESTLIESCMVADGFRWGVAPVYTPTQSESTVAKTEEEKAIKKAHSKQSTKK